MLSRKDSRFFGPIGFSLRAVMWFGLIASLSADEPDGSAASDAVFGLTKLHEVKLTIAEQEYAALEPAGGGFPFGPGGPGPGGPPSGPGRPGGPGRPALGAPDRSGIPAAGGFGFEFPEVHAALEFDDAKFANVAVRYKGNANYMMSARNAKRPLKIDFDQFVPAANLHGIKKLSLHTSAFDATRARESLGYQVFREAGVPAPRTALAEVTLSVPGKYDEEYLGLYNVVEQVDKAFLKRHFKSDKGLLLKPEGMRGIVYLGDDAEAYKGPYDGKTDGDEQQWQRLIDFARLVNDGDDEQFARQVDEYLDVEAFVRYLAVNALLANYDSFIGLGHNYYLYLVPATNKFVIFPWDLDLAFGSHPMFGPMEQQVDFSVNHPHAGELKLVDRLLALPEVKQAYQQELRRLNDTVFTVKALADDIAALDKVTKEPLAKEKKAAEARREGGGFGGGMMFGANMDLKTFVQRRHDAVAAQLDGKSQGRLPAPGMPGGPGGPGGGFNPAAMFVGPLINAGDKNRDRKLSKEEMETAVGTLLEKFDKDSDGQLNDQELQAAIGSLIQPPQIGPPGGPNPGPPGAPGRR
jgi:spore coat protein CotH